MSAGTGRFSTAACSGRVPIGGNLQFRPWKQGKTGDTARTNIDTQFLA